MATMQKQKRAWNMTVLDLKEHSNSEWHARFVELIEKIRLKRNPDQLSTNYHHLDQQYCDYDAFHLLISKEKVLGFAAMQTMHFPKPIARVLTRLYYIPEIRHNSLKAHILPSFASKHILPVQVELARQLGKKAIFLSFQGLKRRQFTKNLAFNLTKYYKQNWTVPEAMFYTARPQADGQLLLNEDVWQNIAVLKFDDQYEFPLPSMKIDEWKKRFS